MKIKDYVILVLYVLILATSYSQNINESTIDIDQNDKLDWFRDARFGMFIHYGLYSQCEGYWNDKPVKGIGEWIFKFGEIPVEDYKGLAKTFNPKNLDPETWVKLAKEAGMKYVVITSKHHDGFALFDSAHPFNVVDATPYKKDIIEQFVEACRKYGLKFGFYYSQNQDWTESGAQGNDWAKGYEYSKEGFQKYMQEKALPQIKELLTQYGKVDVIWFDTPYKMSKEESKEFLDVAKAIQPTIIVSGRIGNELGDYVQMEDNNLPKIRQDFDWEVPVTMNHTWAYKKDDHHWKSTKYLLWQLTYAVSMNGNYLLNIGPKSDGSVPEESVKRLKEVSKWMKVNNEAIDGAKPSPYKHEFSWGSITQQTGKFYLNITEWPTSNKIALYGLKTQIDKASLLEGNIPVKITSDGAFTIFNLPSKATDPYVSVVKVEISEPLIVDEILVQRYDGNIVLETEASINTTGAKLRFGALTMFGKAKGSVQWNFMVVYDGKYKLELITTGRKRMSNPMAPAMFDQGHLVNINLNGALNKVEVVKDYEEKAPKDLYNNFKVTDLGMVELKQGMNSLEVIPLKIENANKAGFSLRQVRLVPVK